MSLQTFFDNFALLADAPNGVAKLRELILQLAVQGKLVPQDLNEEPASALLRSIEKQKENLGGKCQSRRKQAGEILFESNFPLPKGWELTSLGNVTSVTTGYAFKSPDYSNNGVFVLRVTNIQSDSKINKDDAVYMPEQKITSQISKYYLDQFDVLLVMVGGSLGKIGLVTPDLLPALLNQNMWRFKPLGFSYKYLIFLLKYINNNQLKITASTHGHLVMSDYLQQPIGLPPLEEQKRIVTKVDELMRLCDELEAWQQARRESCVRLNNATLAPLNNATSLAPEEFAQAAARLTDNFAALYDTAETVGHLRSTILQLAVQGKLVPQDPHDGYARDLLKKIKADREATAKSKKIKLKQFSLSESPTLRASLPSNWQLEALGNLVEAERSISYGVLVPGHNLEQGIPFVRVQDLDVRNPPAKPSKAIAPDIEKQYARTRLKGGEILLGVVGSIGKLGIVPKSWEGANIARAVSRIAPHHSLSRDYLVIALQSPEIQSYFLGTTRTLAQPTLNVSLIELAPIPLPPLEEQKRIVVKVNQLMVLCDELEAKLRQAETDSEKLIKAAVHHIFTTIEQSTKGYLATALTGSVSLT